MRLLLQLSEPGGAAPTIGFTVDGDQVNVVDDGSTLLEVLREGLGRRTPKDGCSPQGQCGCCTVWVDGQPRIACVTPARRMAGRAVTTLDGLDEDRRRQLAAAFTATGASQCGFCTPGIIMRLANLEERKAEVDDGVVATALLAHLCRCTGWQTILEAARLARQGDPGPSHRDLAAAGRRATLEGGVGQRVGDEVALGAGGFAEDGAPADALVAVPDGSGGWVVAESLAQARARSGKVQGRNSTAAVRHPVEVPPGPWALTLQTSFVEPAYLEPDASWCLPGGEPASSLANGGAFGGKRSGLAAGVARRLADQHGRAVRVVLAREDVVRMGPKRPPVAAGIDGAGNGVVRVARTPGSGPLAGWVAALGSAAPGLRVEEVEVPGPPVSADLRGAGWAEGAVLTAALGSLREGRGSGDPVGVADPRGGRASVRLEGDGAVSVTVAAGEVLDEVVLRSYCIGAVHQALGWVRREAVAVAEDGEVLDLTIRSYGILPARAMPAVTVVVEDGPGPPVAGSDSVFAATAAAAWLAAGLPARWPLERGGWR